MPSDNFTASAMGIICDDAAWPRLPLAYRTGLLLDTTLHPMFGELGSNIWPCAYWSSQPAEAPVPITSNGPSNVMIIQDLRDPATPYEGAQSLRMHFGQRARLVSVDQGGHAVAYLKPNMCANDTVTAYLAHGTFPASDSFCPAESAQSAALQAQQAQSATKTQAIQTLLKRMKP